MSDLLTRAAKIIEDAFLKEVTTHSIHDCPFRVNRTGIKEEHGCWVGQAKEWLESYNNVSNKNSNKMSHSEYRKLMATIHEDMPHTRKGE